MGVLTKPLFLVAALAATALASTVGAQPATPLATETIMIPANDAGIQLHVRNKRPTAMTTYSADNIVLFVHGATYPSETGFDIPLGGVSWLEYIAARGYDAYIVDVRGYGRSTRPAAMGEPPEKNEPFARTDDAVRDVAAAVDFIRHRRGVEKINLVGWSWGTAIMGAYAADNNERVSKLVLYAPLWVLKDAPPIRGDGAYRTVQKEPARARGLRGIPEARKEEISPTAWFDQWWAANLSTDPAGAAQNPPVVRAPNGVLKDLAEHWIPGKPHYDPSKIKVPTLAILAEWDQDTPIYMAQEVFAKLTNAPKKRLVILGEGTHAIALEKNRLELFREVQAFLDEGRAR